MSIFLTACSHTTQNDTEPSSSPSSSAQSSSPASPTASEKASLIQVSPDMLKDTKTVKVSLENGLKFTLTIYPQIAPNTAKNYLDKFSSGYYNGKTFHRVEDWVVQGGDPKGDGTGGGNIPTELNNQPYNKGAVGVARGGDIKISNDSQFFVVTKDSSFLNENYTNFGQVTDGMDDVLKIKIGDKIKSTSVE